MARKASGHFWQNANRNSKGNNHAQGKGPALIGNFVNTNADGTHILYNAPAFLSTRSALTRATTYNKYPQDTDQRRQKNFDD